MRYTLPAIVLLAALVPACNQQSDDDQQIVADTPPPARPLDKIEPLEPAPPAGPKVEPAPTPQPQEPTAAPTPRQYTIQKGDTLWSIAVRFLGDGKRYREIVELNPGLEPNKLLIGKTILLPAPEASGSEK
ncbi:MAG: LysM peptidoglycan-binding domain-containing protein [Phycisphaerae bacterium]|nr:LysM peptidoglycan-binding domain-containing protein [Phycisphaerae bacterium]